MEDRDARPGVGDILSHLNDAAAFWYDDHSPHTPSTFFLMFAYHVHSGTIYVNNRVPQDLNSELEETRHPSDTGCICDLQQLGQATWRFGMTGKVAGVSGGGRRIGNHARAVGTRASNLPNV